MVGVTPSNHIHYILHIPKSIALRPLPRNLMIFILGLIGRIGSNAEEMIDISVSRRYAAFRISRNDLIGTATGGMDIKNVRVRGCGEHDLHDPARTWPRES